MRKATYLNNGISCLFSYLLIFFMGETPFFGAVVGNPMRLPKYFLKSKLFIAINFYNLTYIQGYIKDKNSTNELSNT